MPWSPPRSGSAPRSARFVGGSILAGSAGARCSSFSGLASALWLFPWPAVVRDLPDAASTRETPVAAPEDRRSLVALGDGRSSTRCGNYGFYFVLAWLPLYLVQQRGLTIMQMTMLATLVYVVQAISALILGNSSDRWTRSGRSEASMRRGMMVAEPVGLRGLHARHLRGARHRYRRRAALHLRNVPRGGIGQSLRDRADVRGAARASGTWVGVQNSVGNISGIIGPIVSGIIIDRAGYGGAFALSAAVAAAGAFLWAFAVPAIRQIELD